MPISHYVDLHDIYRAYSTLTFNFDNTTVKRRTKGSTHLRLRQRVINLLIIRPFCRSQLARCQLLVCMDPTREGCKGWAR